MKSHYQSENAASGLDLKIRRNTGIFLLLILATLPACQTNKNLQPSQAVESTGAAGFDAADTNHDGKLSRNEASDFLVSEIFTARDANHDGHMTREEWNVPGDAARSEVFEARDKNDDRVVTKEEALAYGRSHGVANKIIRDGDKNGDGLLDRAEVETYYKRREGPPR